MIRFPNPGSNIPTFIRIFQTLYTYLNNKAWFTLDDMSLTLTNMNLAASSGYVGEQALALSTRTDRSRDPLYNQSKMYAELFRALGWIASNDPKKALQYRFTLLGDHMAMASVDPKSIFEESILGINRPNDVLVSKSEVSSRVFSAILRTANRLDGYIYRDEIILAILKRDFVNESDIFHIISEITKLRGSASRIRGEMSKMSEKISVKVNIMRNYTRFILASLLYCEWFTSENTKKHYPDGRAMTVYKLTSYGVNKATSLESAVDVRLSEFKTKETETQKALIRMGFFTMLQRANFDISPVMAQIASDSKILQLDPTKTDLIFSPYQTVRPEIADDVLGHKREWIGESQDIEFKYDSSLIPKNAVTSQQTTTIKLKQVDFANTKTVSAKNSVEEHIATLIEEGKSDEEIANVFYNEYSSAAKGTFYPLIADLFTSIGFVCQATRDGINYKRWDAMANDEKQSIPIEIKSPSEERFISIKAVRQALENKVILLSRKSYITDWDTATLAVGYNPPNDRAEVSRLISDIKNTFGIRVGIIDFRSLVKLASASMRNEGSSYVHEIRNMEGPINVENI